MCSVDYRPPISVDFQSLSIENLLDVMDTPNFNRSRACGACESYGTERGHHMQSYMRSSEIILNHMQSSVVHIEHANRSSFHRQTCKIFTPPPPKDKKHNIWLYMIMRAVFSHFLQLQSIHCLSPPTARNCDIHGKPPNVAVETSIDACQRWWPPRLRLHNATNHRQKFFSRRTWCKTVVNVQSYQTYVE